MKKRTALFPGSFDPITKGHEYIVKKSLDLFEEVVIGVGKNSSKQSMFDLDTRIKWIEQTFKNYSEVKLFAYDGLTVDFCKQQNIRFIVRGIRSAADFEFEKNIAQMNKAINAEIETIFIMTSPELSCITSTIIRELIKEKADISQFVPDSVKV